jgi:hypothetical protein
VKAQRGIEKHLWQTRLMIAPMAAVCATLDSRAQSAPEIRDGLVTTKKFEGGVAVIV